ncbi:cysteine peptidase family C39 domain-containing protein [[Mycoplasma] testudinis]|uniref:cysteine peptidase family C39 domain-containing protein n=1 Tax=[Mycoplasma] testudinis TaxID=33924 RepID=UPI00048138BC|nr:cysteine peptidase family C39 domain-containing protein [[Mycoplasma] testudinis]
MQIVLQETENECGACVVTMLAQELHDIDISRSDVLTKAQISSSGMNLENLESLASEFGIELETYECTYQEFKELNQAKYYVVMVRKLNGLHFVIVQKFNNHLIVYDSAKGKYKISYRDFQNSFANVICCVGTKKLEWNSNEIKNQIKMFSFTNWKTLIWSFILEIVAIGFGIGVAQLFKVLVKDTIGYGTTFNLLIIIVPFSIMKVIEILSQEIVQWIQARKIQSVYQKFWKSLLQIMFNRDFHFYKTKPAGNVFEIDNHLQNVCNLYLSQITRLIAAILMLAITTGILASLNTWFIVLSFAQIIINTTIIGINFWWQKNKIIKTIILTEKHHQNLTDLENTLTYESDWIHYQTVSEQIQKNLSHMAANNKINFMGQSLFNGMGHFFQYIFQAAALWVGVYLIVNQQQINLADLVYAVSLQALFSSYTDNIITFGLQLNSFFNSKKKLNLFLNFQAAENHNKIQKIPFQINTISFRNVSFLDGPKTVFKNWSSQLTNLTVLTGQNASGKSTLLKSLTNKVKLNEGTIAINGIALNEFSSQWLNTNVIYLDGTKKINGWLVHQNALENLKKANLPSLMKLLNNFEWFTTDPMFYSTGQLQLTRLLSLLHLENKIILLDEITNGINEFIKKDVFEQIIKTLSSKNFVILIDHDPNVIKLASNEVKVVNHEI